MAMYGTGLWMPPPPLGGKVPIASARPHGGALRTQSPAAARQRRPWSGASGIGKAENASRPELAACLGARQSIVRDLPEATGGSVGDSQFAVRNPLTSYFAGQRLASPGDLPFQQSTESLVRLTFSLAAAYSCIATGARASTIGGRK